MSGYKPPVKKFNPDVFGYALTDIAKGQAVELDPPTGKYRNGLTFARDLYWGLAIEDIKTGDALRFVGEWGKVGVARP